MLDYDAKRSGITAANMDKEEEIERNKIVNQ
jgi:hypothetical protein